MKSDVNFENGSGVNPLRQSFMSGQPYESPEGKSLEINTVSQDRLNAINNHEI